MKARCLNPKNDGYKDYGGRGITVCDRWLTFENFYEDMGDPPSDKHQINRINNNGGYLIENCDWVLSKDNCRNTRWNNNLTFKGETKTVAEWAEVTGIRDSTLRTRLSLGWSVERTLTTPVNSNLARRR
jgi:hypothetical protein